MKSIIQSNKYCYLCGRQTGLHLHHCFYGKNRKTADKYGLTVYLCQEHHEGANGVHGKNGHALDMAIKANAQRVFELSYSRAKFLEVFGRNYIEGDL